MLMGIIFAKLGVFFAFLAILRYIWWKTKGDAMTLRKIEKTLDRCNHLMELLRTCLALCTLILQVVIFLKLFGDGRWVK